MPNANNYSHIQGWGADLDHSKRPAYPKERTPPRFTDPSYKPEQQIQKIPVFKSIERPTIPHVFGTSTPPAGLSGLIRKQAYKLGEAKVHRWMMLLLADRINVVEGIIEDLSRGHIPNIFAEMGLKSEIKYNGKNFAKKLIFGAAIVGGTYLLLKSRNKKVTA